MKNDGYYAGHTFKWMKKFLDTVPKKQHVISGIAFALASCIHHQYFYTKQNTFKLDHNLLTFFGLDRRYIKPYLLRFQKANLIDVKIKQGTLPAIHLLLVPNNKVINNNKRELVVKSTCTDSLNNQLLVVKSTCSENPKRKGGKKYSIRNMFRT